jgi:uncharacterized membrane protein YccC
MRVKMGNRGGFFLISVQHRIEKIRSPLIDLHDPVGIYFHRAGNACLATLIAAGILYFFPSVRPLLVLSALCFTLTTGRLNCPGDPITLCGSLAITVLGTGFVILSWFQPLLQGAILIVLGFLVHYLAGYHRAFAGGIFVWILCLLAAAGNPSVERLPGTLLSLVFGCAIVYLCYFAIWPYNPVKVFQANGERIRSRLSRRLQRAIEFYPASEKDSDDRAIVSLFTAQHSLVRQIAWTKRIPLNEIERSRQEIGKREELFEAILVLEQSLQAFPCRETLLSSELTTLVRWVAEFLQRGNIRPIKLDPCFERSLEERAGDPNRSLATRLSWGNLQQAILQVIEKTNAIENEALIAEISEFISIDEPKPRKIFDIHYPVHRRALRTAMAILLAMVVVAAVRPPHGEWLILSAFIVSRDTVGSSLWKAEGRFIGAASGAIASLAIYALIRPDRVLIFITAFLTIFPYVYLLSALDNYGFAYFFLQVAYVCFLAAIGKPLSVELIEWRAIEIAIGCALGIVVSLLILPTSARPSLQKGQLKAWNEMHRWFRAIVSLYRSPTDENHRNLEPLSVAAARSVFALEKELASRKHELIGQLKQGLNPADLRRKDSEFIQAYQPIYRALLFLEAIAKDLPPIEKLSIPIEETVQGIDRIFAEINGAIGTHSLYLIAPMEDSSIALENNPDELNFFRQLNLLYRAIVDYSDRRNQFLSSLAGNRSGKNSRTRG